MGLGVVTSRGPDTINRDHPAGVNMTYATTSPNKKPLRFPVPHDDVTTRLLSWVRGIVQSNHELVDALERLRFSYKALLAGKSVRDAEQVLWQAEVALKDAERSKNALAPDSRRGSDDRA
jgi:hypothetical protein